MTERLCRCGKPTMDDAYVCPGCTGKLERALGDGAWLEAQLQVTITGQRGIDYRTLGGSPSAEPPLPLGWAAVTARDDLRAVLGEWVKLCQDDHVRASNGPSSPSEGTITGLSRWLLWRAPGLALHMAGPDAVDEIVSATRKCERIVNTKPDKWYAGPCNETSEDGIECGADLYARAEKGEVKCPRCEAVYDVQLRRAWLLAAAEDRLADAATLARAVSWLGGNNLTRHRVYMWAQRGRIVAKAHDGQSPMYRIGDAIDLLAADARRNSG